MSIRILLVDDHRLFRDGLRSLVEDNKDLKVVGEAADGQGAVELARKLAPDVIIMDITLPDISGIEATRRILAAQRRARVLGLSMHIDRRYITEILGAGACGFLPKNADADEFVRAIREVADGRTYLSPMVAGELVEGLVKGRPASKTPMLDRLTCREREVLYLLAEGRSMKEIAGALQLSVKTVHTHRQKMMDKTNLHSVAELTKLAVQEGLVTL